MDHTIKLEEKAEFRSNPPVHVDEGNASPQNGNSQRTKLLLSSCLALIAVGTNPVA
jgi:hypothetical protein